jgi:hypothetical protein
VPLHRADWPNANTQSVARATGSESVPPRRRRSTRSIQSLSKPAPRIALLVIRRPGDPPPTLTDRQRAIVESFAALVRPWIGPVRHHGHVAPPFACLPGGEARDRRREPGRRAAVLVLTSGRDRHTTAVGSDRAHRATLLCFSSCWVRDAAVAGPFVRRQAGRSRSGHPATLAGPQERGPFACSPDRDRVPTMRQEG